MRHVHRAVADLRRGTPVLLDGAAPLVVAAAETLGAAGLRDLMAVAAGPAVLLLAPSRAAAVLGRPEIDGSGAAPEVAVALAVPGALTEPGVLRGLADPTAEQVLAEPPVPAGPAPALAAAALALAKLARLLPAVLAAPCDAGTAAAGRDLLRVAADDVLSYPARAGADLARVAEAAVPLDGAPDARVVAFRAPDGGVEHLAIVIGHPEREAAPLVRIHSECFTGDLLGSLRCDCGPQLRRAIGRMGAEGAGVVLYLAQEGRGIGLASKLRAYAMQDRGLDTLDANRALGWGADERSYLAAAAMLESLGVRTVRLLTNNPVKVAALAACGVTVAARESHLVPPNGVNDRYLATKVSRFGHLPD